jgi:acetoin:2,6-dichlorophenolindophenol oxidoreductase subunit alpha
VVIGPVKRLPWPRGLELGGWIVDENRRANRADGPPSPTDLLALHRWMVVSRLVEQACGRANPRWFPAEGEEATIVGSFYGLRADDGLAPHYRGPFVVYLMRGAELVRLLGQALGREIGYARGRAVPFTGPAELSIVPWVAGDLGTSLGIGTGAGLAFQREGGERVAVVSFGDGTVNRGDFHENLNLAACWKLPVVYVCQNNGWAISEPGPSYSPVAAADRAAAYGIPGVMVDGNDVLAVNEAVQAAVARARRGDGPSLIEARTYRLRGHWEADAASYRDRDELALWMEREPIGRLEARLTADRIANPAELQAVWRDVEREVAAAVAEAQAAPAAGLEGIGLEDVYWKSVMGGHD